MNQRGKLVLIGGAEKRSGEMTVLRKTVEINYAKTIVVIPTASSHPRSLGDSYYYTFKDLGAKDVHVFDIRSKEEANNQKYLDKITSADLIFFTGGDQVKLVETLKHTKLFSRIKNMWMAGATIAGTSAGAAGACDPLIYDGDKKGFSKGVAKYGEGFGFIKNITIDTHFTERGRIYRLSQFLLSGKSHRGIGLGENTGIIISPDNTMEVIGSGMVTLINSKRATFSNYQMIEDFKPISANGLNFGFLHSGAVFNLQYWTIDRERSGFERFSRVESFN